ncbi:DUF6531 domain-containing protein [Curtobacterium sp. MCSS17_015]|uniref:DUF6531 domain-containing protein n=1 Tax=Curtobacterium sp. MCSS17_015 TaxID=2175666 RepID=UPI000DA91563|nr:DUF6531 domain-containing protein [Curtobacterium sp. MCSS17_015]WIB27166.1 DUF6531 domain-containing protein [Curtobacterium sp. MCSS17_015]
MADLHGAEPLEFDNGTADALIAELTSSADSIDGQAGSRSSYVSTAAQEFRGHFADLFGQNASTAASDATRLTGTLREVAGWVRTLKTAAEQENARRKRARDWQAEHDSRNWFEQGHDWLFGEDKPPTEEAEPAPVFHASTPPTTARQTPTPGSGGGGGGGTSSARPDDLRSFATGSSSLNGQLSGRGSALRGKLDDFASRCKWGSISAHGVATAIDKWLEANETDVSWANTVASAFEAAGGSGSVSTVSDVALAAALQGAGVSAERSGLTIEPPQAFGAVPTTGYSMDPINTSTGNFLESELDLGFAGASESLRLTRMYNSLDDRSGLFGPGWASVLETRLDVDDEGVSLTQADGRVLRFPRDGDGWATAVEEYLRLTREDDRLVVRDSTGAWWAFSPAGTWLAAGSGPGTTMTVERDADGALTRLAHERGRWIDVETLDGRVVVARASDGRRVEYAYDEAGRLTHVHGATGTRTYEWGDAGLVVAVVDEDGVVEARNTYDERRRVVEQVSPHGRTVRFAYLPGRVTVVSDPDGGRSNTWISDAKGRLVGVVDTDDARQSMQYDARGRLVSVTDRSGAVTVHAVDARGRRTRTVTPSGADITYGYDERDRVTTVVTETGSVVTYEYVGDDRDPSVVVDPEGGRSELTWERGLLRRAVDPTGVVVELEHDEHGELVATRNALGDVMRVERDPAGRPTAVVMPSGARTEYRYDQAGRVTSRRDADGAVWSFEHEGTRLVATTDPTGARTTYGYGTNGEFERTTDPLGRTTSRTFDDLGNLAALDLPDGGHWTFVHDPLSRLRETVDPAGQVWRRDHDRNGDLTGVTDPTGQRVEGTTDLSTGVATLRDAFGTTTVRSDQYGRPVEVASADGTAELVTYDRCGRPVELVDGEGGLTRLERDLAGRVTAVVEPSGARTTYEYDACGRPVASTDSLGARTELGYDADGRVVTRTLPTGDVERTAYDAVGRPVSRTTPGAGTSRWRWDAAGRLVATQDVRSGQRRFRYDAAGQLVEAVDGLGGVTRFDHDLRGRVTSVTDPLGGVTRYEYDQADRVVAVSDPLGRRSTASYDAAGRQTGQTDPDGHTTTWTFEDGGRQTTVAVDGRTVSEVRVDRAARSIVVTDHSGGAGRAFDHELRYDRRGLLVSRSRGDRAVVWEYDADGRRTARTDPDGTRTVYRRDAAGRVVAVQRADLPDVSFVLDPVGRPVQAAAGDVVHAWSWERGRLVTHTTTTTDGVEVARVEHDAEDRIRAVVYGDGTTSYTHDAAGQLVRAERPDGSVSTWEYDAAGRLVAERSGDTSLRHEHDAAGQLVASTDVATGARVEYVSDGLGRRARRTAADGSTTEYAWDDLGYLAGVVERDATYVETGGHRIRVDVLGEPLEVDGAETWWDSAAPLPSLTSIGGTAVLGLAGGITAVGGTWAAPSWRPGRATDLADPWRASGATAGPGATGAADAPPGLPAGVGLSVTGGLAIAGLEWLGARVYDPVARGFLSVDPLPPVIGTAWAANPYAYAGNDPLHAADPLGLRPATDADLQAYQAEHGSHWEYVAAGVVGAIGVGIGVALLFTGVGGPAGIALMAASGAMVSGAISTASQKATKGTVDWGQVAVDTAVGGITGAVGGGGMMVASRAAAAASSTSRLAGAAAVNASVNGAVGATSSGVSYAVNHEGEWNNRDFLAHVAGGGASSALGSMAGPAGGTFAQRFGQTTTSVTARVATLGFGGGSSVIGGAADNLIAGKPTSVSDVLWNTGTGVVGASVPGGQSPSASLNQMAQTNIRTFEGVFSGSTNAVRLWQSAGVGGSLGVGTDAAQSWLKDQGVYPQ